MLDYDWFSKRNSFNGSSFLFPEANRKGSEDFMNRIDNIDENIDSCSKLDVAYEMSFEQAALGNQSSMHEVPDHRRQLIFRIRRQLDEGTYDIDDKMELIFDRIIDDIEA